MIVDPDFLDHWRTRMLVDSLGGDELAPLYVLRLWGHCQNRKQTQLKPMPNLGLKALCRYAGDADLLADSMVAAGFIERVDESNGGQGFAVPKFEEKNAQLFAAWENGAKGGRPRKNLTKTHGLPNGNPTVTHGEPDCNPAVTDKSRVDKSRVEQKENPLNPPRGKQGKDSENGYCKSFEAWWLVYPRREGKAKAYDSWKKAGTKLKKDRSMTSADAVAYLLARVEAYAKSPRGKWPLAKIPHPQTWLNQGRYDDDPSAWDADYDDDGTRPSPPPTNNQVITQKHITEFDAFEQKLLNQRMKAVDGQ